MIAPAMKSVFSLACRFAKSARRAVPLALAALVFASLAALRAADAPSTLFYQPSLLADRSQRYAAWSHSITVREERLVMAVPVKQFLGKPGPCGLAIAESEDGVHWRETDPFACPLPAAMAGFCLRWTGKEFIYYDSEGNRGDDKGEYPVILRQYRSKDLKTWEFMGDEFTTRPDKRWYRSRWDELVVLEDDGTFFGYITSEPLPALANDSLGLLQSRDGISWEVLPPPVIEWEGIPSQQTEVSFCEKIGGRYYLGLGTRGYLGHLGYSVMTFVGDSPRGPFRPDKEAFRLCGSTTRDVNWLAKTFHWKGEVLLSNWITTTLDKSFRHVFDNGQSLWIGPLKKLVADKAGHLRIAWWPGNDAAKDAPLPCNLREAAFAHPADQYRGARAAMSIVSPDAITLKGSLDGAIAMLPVTFDFSQGVVIEGTVKATELRGRIGTHQLAAAGGFFFEETPGKGMLLQLQTLGLTRIGVFEFRPEPTFNADEFQWAGFATTRRTGDYHGLSQFLQEDVIGPLGYAPPCGVHHATPHRFRLLVKQGMFEFYLDDLLVQTYITGPTSGRLGLFARSGQVEFSGLKFQAMTPNAKRQ